MVGWFQRSAHHLCVDRLQIRLLCVAMHDLMTTLLLSLLGVTAVQVRSFVELSDMLLENFELPEATKQAWENIL